MLTHTYFLQKVLEQEGFRNAEPDIFIYNIAPDLLAIHPNISPAKTHTLHRSLPAPCKYPKTAYVLYHLLVDDLSHHGYISSGEQEEFNPDSHGYCYLKGKLLVEQIMDIHKIYGAELSFGEAVYRSHLIIEMIYDLIIIKKINAYRSIDVLVDAVNFTAKNKMKEFVETLNWLYGLEKDEISEVMKTALFFITKESMEGIMNLEGRINLYKDKFGLQDHENIFYGNLRDLFQHAVGMINDDELFFQETTNVIKKYNTLPFLR